MIVLADTMVALLAGFVVFPMVFNYGLDIAGGAGLSSRHSQSRLRRCPRPCIRGALLCHAVSCWRDVDGGTARVRDQLDDQRTTLGAR